MALSTGSAGEYKLPKLRTATFWLSTALCILTLMGLGYAIIFSNVTTDIWPKIAGVGMTIFVGFIWIGISYTFLINNDKCANCRISIKDDYTYCNRCDLQKEIEMRNTTETLHCIVGGCDEEIESVDAYKDHYLKKHVNENLAEGYSRPRFEEIRLTDAIYIKKK